MWAFRQKLLHYRAEPLVPPAMSTPTMCGRSRSLYFGVLPVPRLLARQGSSFPFPRLEMFQHNPFLSRPFLSIQPLYFRSYYHGGKQSPSITYFAFHVSICYLAAEMSRLDGCCGWQRALGWHKGARYDTSSRGRQCLYRPRVNLKLTCCSRTAHKCLET